MCRARYNYILFFLLTVTIINGQNRAIDSLKQALKNAKHDTTRIQIYLIWGEKIHMQLPDSALELWKRAIVIADKNLKILSPNHPHSVIFKGLLSNSLNNLGFIYNMQGDIPEALDYMSRSLKIREEIGDKNGMAYSLNDIGYVYQYQGNIPKALDYLGRSLKIQEEIGDKKGIAYSLNNIGFIYNNQGNIPKALECYGKSLKIQENVGDKMGAANSLNNIGTIYSDQGDIPKALQCYIRSLKIQEEIGDKQGIAISLSNIGNIYSAQGDPLVTSSREDAIRAGAIKALDYYGRSLKIKEELGDKKGIASSLTHIGSIYIKHGDPSVTSSREDALKAGVFKALDYYNRSLMIREKIGDKEGITHSLTNIGIVYFKQKNYSKALLFCKRSMQASRDLGYPENIRNAAKHLNQIYKATGNYQLALENYELYIQMRDSINNQATRKASMKQQLKHEYETKAAADSVAHAKETEIKNAELKKQEAEIKAKKNQQYALFGGLGLVIVFAGFMYNRFKVTQKQKSIIELQKSEVEEQKKLVEEKQKEIIDSITYAQRIQKAQLPSDSMISRAMMQKNT